MASAGVRTQEECEPFRVRNEGLPFESQSQDDVEIHGIFWRLEACSLDLLCVSGKWGRRRNGRPPPH